MSDSPAPASASPNGAGVACIDEDECPRCGDEVWRDEVSVGVGIIYGPYGCACGWSEWSEWDSTEGPAPAEDDHPGYYADPRGGLTCKVFLESFPDHLFEDLQELEAKPSPTASTKPLLDFIDSSARAREKIVDTQALIGMRRRGLDRDPS